jgi:hypothetical protein
VLTGSGNDTSKAYPDRPSPGVILGPVGILHRDWIAGTMLVVAGLFILGNRQFPDLLPVMPLIIGLLFLGLFFLTRSAASAVAGSVLVGVGIGVLVVKGSDPDVGTGGFLISLAGGFFLAWILGLMFNIRSLRWWPLVPGFLLLVLGAIVTSGHMGKDVINAAADWWPVLLVLMGAFLLYRARSHAHVSDETTAVPVVVHEGVARPVQVTEHDEHAHETHEERDSHDDEDPDEDEDSLLHSDDGADDATSEHPTAIPSVYPLRPSTHSLADANGGQVGGDRPGTVESL